MSEKTPQKNIASNYSRTIQAILAASIAISNFVPSLPVEANPKNINDNGPTFSGKVRPAIRKLDRFGGDVIQGGQDAIEDFKRGRNQRKLKECEQIDFSTKQCQKLLNKIRKS